MNPISLDGYLDTAPEPGPHPSAAHFDLIRLLDHLDTTEPDSCAQVFACTTETPAATELILHRTQLGNLLRISAPSRRPAPPALPRICASTRSTSSTPSRSPPWEPQ